MIADDNKIVLGRPVFVGPNTGTSANGAGSHTQGRVPGVGLDFARGDPRFLRVISLRARRVKPCVRRAPGTHGRPDLSPPPFVSSCHVTARSHDTHAKETNQIEPVELRRFPYRVACSPLASELRC